MLLAPASWLLESLNTKIKNGILELKIRSE